jgi:hypothetical protein
LCESYVVFVDDVLRAPRHEFVPRFSGPDHLGCSRDGGERGLSSGGVRPGERLRRCSIADNLAEPESKQRRSLQCRLRPYPPRFVRSGKCARANNRSEPVSARKCDPVRAASSRASVQPLNYFRLNEACRAASSFGSPASSASRNAAPRSATRSETRPSSRESTR